MKKLKRIDAKADRSIILTGEDTTSFVHFIFLVLRNSKYFNMYLINYFLILFLNVYTSSPTPIQVIQVSDVKKKTYTNNNYNPFTKKNYKPPHNVNLDQSFSLKVDQFIDPERDLFNTPERNSAKQISEIQNRGMIFFPFL